MMTAHRTDILSWDDLNYAYAGLKADVDNSRVTSCPKAQADTFYEGYYKEASGR